MKVVLLRHNTERQLAGWKQPNNTPIPNIGEMIKVTGDEGDTLVCEVRTKFFVIDSRNEEQLEIHLYVQPSYGTNVKE